LALETRYAARLDWPVERIVESLAALLPVRRHPIARQRIAFLDTPDGRIGRAGASLAWISDSGGNRIEWRQGSVRARCALARAVQFAWDLPQGSVRDRVATVIEARRLLPLAESEQDGVLLDVLDDVGKTIARITVVAGRARAVQRRAPWQPFRPFVVLSALRGYDAQCTGPLAILDSRPGLERSELDLQGHVLRGIGTSVPQDVSAYRVELAPEARADAGTLQMYRELLRIAIASHAGVVADIDGAFLHDLRASGRRAGTLLGQFDGVLPQAEAEHLAAELCWLDRITGPVHDLDVLLAELRSPSKRLDEDRQRLLLTQLEQARAAAQNALARQLTSERWHCLVSLWQEAIFLASCVPAADGCGALPLKAEVSRRGAQLYRRALSSIEHVRGDTPPHELRRIRIEVQELRDLLDATASLYEPRDVAIVQHALTRLQRVLNDFDAACAQASWLRQYAAALEETKPDLIAVCRAIEALADLTSRRADELRQPANQALLCFGESGTRAAFERVFHGELSIEMVQ
jgi:CHAD domain-containing protein